MDSNFYNTCKFVIKNRTHLHTVIALRKLAKKRTTLSSKLVQNNYPLMVSHPNKVQVYPTSNPKIVMTTALTTPSIWILNSSFNYKRFCQNR